MPAYRRRKSTSGCIADISYDDKTETLSITFQQRGAHTYHAVPKVIADGLKRASSKGDYFNQVIRPNY